MRTDASVVRRLAAGLVLALAAGLGACASAPPAARPDAQPQLSAEDRNAFFVHAARTGAIDDLRRYLEQGAEINAFDSLDQTALIAAVDHQQLEIVRLLLDRGADPRLADHAGWTPLIHAIYFGSDETLLGLLLDRGADIDARNDRGVTALYLAAAAGREPQVQFLLKRGADPQLATEAGYTPLRIAQLRGYERIVALLGGEPPAAPAPGAKGAP